MANQNQNKNQNRNQTRRRKTSRKKGGNFFTDLAVPAVLLYANNTFGKRHMASKSSSRRYRRSHRK